MYQKPTMQKLGSLRSLTQSGSQPGYDILGIFTNNADSCGRGISICTRGS